MRPVSRSTPKHLKTMRPAEIAATLADDARVIVPSGTCSFYHPALPVGFATMLVERLADDLSAEFGVLRAPTVEYGVNPDHPLYRGRVAVRKKTLHRFLNDMLASWECNGVSECILLTAHGYDPHQEALGTLATTTARVRVVDVFAVNLSDLIGDPMQEVDRAQTLLALARYCAPELIDPAKLSTSATANAMANATANGAALGTMLYDRMRARISERIFLAPAPVE